MDDNKPRTIYNSLTSISIYYMSPPRHLLYDHPPGHIPLEDTIYHHLLLNCCLYTHLFNFYVLLISKWSLIHAHSFFHSSALFPPHTICQLCSKPYRDPRILPCLHSFCTQCLYKEIERSGTKQNMECPTCQRSITIPEGGVNVIPQNLHLGFEVEVAGYISKIGNDGEKSCDACVDGAKLPKGLQWSSVVHVISSYVPSATNTTNVVKCF